MDQIDPVNLFHRVVYERDQVLNIRGRCVIHVDNEICVLGRYLCTTNTMTLETRRFNLLSCVAAGWIAEHRAAARQTQWLC